jgi:protein SCO1/2
VGPQDFPDKVSLVFFGYTSCPDVCPLTLSNVTRAFQEMEEDGSRIQFFLITVDPNRDTPERLQQYLEAFHPSFLGLLGTEEETREVATAFGAFFARTGDGPNYTVDHSARTFVVDRNAQIPLTFPVTATSHEIARDLTTLLEEGS